eukprot:GGOE01020302.1.p1 GENE.GGOE01020302.1~~GGOE01020302.1.p1  ORF type:complete len:440 (-),score=100.19 GGOE01020302.1:317-1597(-)
MAEKKPTFQESLDVIRLKHRSKYDAEYNAPVLPPGSPVWEVDEAKGRYVDHVAKCIYSTPAQLIKGMKDGNWAVEFASSGLMLDEALVTAMQTAANTQKEVKKAQVRQRELQLILKRVRHFGSTLCIVAKKTAESCLQESGKWPKNLQSLGEHCNNMIAFLQPMNQQQPEVAQLVNLHSLCCSLTEQIYGGDVTWPATAELILTTIVEFQNTLRALQEAEHSAPPPLPVSPGPAPPAALCAPWDEVRRALKAKNRALGYIFRFKKLLKKCLPMCLNSTEGWAEKVLELVGVLEEITKMHTDIDPDCEEQKWLDKLQEQTRLLCDTALVEDPAWVGHCQTLSATLDSVEALFPNPIPPVPIVPVRPIQATVIQGAPVAAQPPAAVAVPVRPVTVAPPVRPLQALRPVACIAPRPFPTAGGMPKRPRL